VNVGPLARARLAEAELLLADACPFDRASDVADEKLFAPGPTSAAQAFGAWDGNELVGVAAFAARWLRLIAVSPRARKSGVGSALLAAVEAAARADGQTRLSALDQPGNYLAPGVDERNTDALAWLAKRGFKRRDEIRTNVLIDVRGNPRVTAERASEAAARAADDGYEIRRARPDDRRALLDAIAKEFGGAWPYEVERALGHVPMAVAADGDVRAIVVPAVHVAIKNGAFVAFAAHDGNNRGLGWFGPTGTWPEHRGHGLGEALLLACLLDVATEHSQCEVAWIGPRPFYEKVAGIAGERRFIALTKQLT
jgi:GNAT superfamily N-acetyltransferase